MCCIGASAQVGRTNAAPKEPRALGLLELTSDGKAHLIPITIRVDGQYFDASAYKAAPVPMALWGDTVYEGIRTGVSQGLFTVTGALQRKETNEWIGEGRWQSASALAAAAKVPKKAESSEPRGMNVDEGPPVLRRSGAAKPQPPDAPVASSSSPGAAPGNSNAPSAVPAGSPSSNPPSTSPTATTSQTSPDGASKSSAENVPEDKDGPVLKRGTPPASSTSPTTTTSVTTPSGTTSSSDQAGKSAADNSAPDKDAPVLKRGIPSPTPKSKSDDFKVFSPKETPPAKSATKPPATPSSASTASAAANAVQLIPAISDSGGPDLRPYSYNVKPDEELAFRKKMLGLAADEVRARVAQLSGAPVSSAAASSAPGKTRAAKPLSPSFDDVQLKIFDLSNINEPELVLTATARMPATAGKAGASSNLQFSDLQFMVTLVAREDVNGEFHKAMANVTDAQHLDVLPRLDLIDAVDVDGDGRGELLFRQVSDAGNAFVVYRVIGDRLYPLFQGTPGR